MDLKEFYENVDVTFEGTIEGMGEIADGYKKWLSGLLDDIVQKLPDEYLPKNIHIYFSTLEKIIERWENPENPDYNRQKNSHFLKDIKRADKQWKSRAGGLRNVADIFKAWNEISRYANGCSTPTFRKEDNSLVMGCVIDIVIDRHTVFIPNDYQKGVIVHEIVEFTTKCAALKEHKDEIKKSEDIIKVLKKYLKAGSYPPSKEYDEHEEIVNREAKRLGFKKEIAVMEKGDITTDNIRRT